MEGDQDSQQMLSMLKRTNSVSGFSGGASSLASGPSSAAGGAATAPAQGSTGFFDLHTNLLVDIRRSTGVYWIYDLFLLTVPAPPLAAVL